MKVKMLIALVLGLTVSVNASEARLKGMGNPGILVKDNSEIFTFPSAIGGYSQEVSAEMRQNSNSATYTLGGNMNAFGGVVGVYLNNKLRGFGEVSGAGINASAGFDGVQLNNTLGALYGMNMGGMGVGFSVDIAADKASAKTGDTERTTNLKYFKVAGGASAENFDASLSLELPSVSNSDYEHSGFGATATGRYSMNMGGGALIPAVVLKFGSFQNKDMTGDEDVVNKWTTIVADAALGYNYSINETSMLVAGVEALGLSMTSHDKVSNSTTVAPKFYLGVESQVKSWCTARFGGAKKYELYGTKNETDPDAVTETSSASAPFDVNLGATFSFGNFDIDANVNEALLFNGPNFITGGASAMATEIAVKYNFGSTEAK